MKKKKKKLMGSLPKLPEGEIYLNVTRLEDGDYELKIMDKNKLIKKNKIQEMMKTKKLILTIPLLLLMQMGVAQQKKDTIKQMNLLDKQVEVLAPIFAMMEMDGAEQFNDISKFMELVELSNLAPEMKQHLREQYKLYDLTLDPVKKDSAKIVFNKMLKKAMVQSAKKDK